MDELAKVSPGDPFRFPARVYNAMIDMLRRDLQRRANLESGAPAIDTDMGVIRVVNNTGSARDRFEILGIDTAVIDPADNPDAFKNDSPLNGATLTDAHVGKFCILLQPLASGSAGLAVAIGVVPVQLDVIHADHTFAEIIASDATKLRTSPLGTAEILWKESGTGTKWGIVRIGHRASPGPKPIKLISADTHGKYSGYLMSGSAGASFSGTSMGTTLLPGSPQTVEFWNIEEAFYGTGRGSALDANLGGSGNYAIGMGIYVGYNGTNHVYVGIGENFGGGWGGVGAHSIGESAQQNWDSSFGFNGEGGSGKILWYKSGVTGGSTTGGGALSATVRVPYATNTAGTGVQLKYGEYALAIDQGGRIDHVQTGNYTGTNASTISLLTITNSAGINLNATAGTSNGDSISLNIAPNLSAGAGIQISTSGAALEIKNTGVITLANAGGITVADDGNGNFTVEAAVKSIVAGSGCTVTDLGGGNYQIDVP